MWGTGGVVEMEMHVEIFMLEGRLSKWINIWEVGE